MTRISSWAIGLLALTTAGALVFGVSQYQRAERLERDAASRIALTPAAASAPDILVEEQAPAVADAPADDAGAPAPGQAASRPVQQRGAEPRGRPMRFDELMEDPDFAAAWQAMQKARLDQPYAALFRKLNLSPAQTEQLKSLLVERTTSRMDVMNAARKEGLGGRENRDKLGELVQQAQAEIDANIAALLGDAGYAELKRYEQTAPQREVVRQLESRLSYSGAPLSDAQAEAMVTVLRETGAVSPGGSRITVYPSAGSATRVMRAGAIPDAALARAQAVLSPAQLEALRQLQAESEAQEQMNEIMRERARRSQPPPPPPAPPGQP